MDEVNCMNTVTNLKYVNFSTSDCIIYCERGRTAHGITDVDAQFEKQLKTRFWKNKPEIIDLLSRLIQLLNAIIDVFNSYFDWAYDTNEYYV